MVVPFFRVHEVAFVELQDSTEDCPMVRIVGFVESKMVGVAEVADKVVCLGFTVIVTVSDAVPPLPLQIIV